MKLTVKKMAIIASVTAVALTSFAVCAKVGAAPGNHILNMGDSTYTTQSPTNCAGVTFPTSIEANAVNPNSDNQIAINPTAAGTESCSTMYTSTSTAPYEPNSYCLVTLQLKHGKVVTLGAHSNAYNPHDPSSEGCKAIGNTDVMILSSGS